MVFSCEEQVNAGLKQKNIVMVKAQIHQVCGSVSVYSQVYIHSFQWATRVGNKMPCNRHAVGIVFLPAKVKSCEKAFISFLFKTCGDVRWEQ